MADVRADTPAGIPGSRLPGPFGVGAYARKLQAELRKRARLQLVGEAVGVRRSKTKVYFELRDADGALPCSMWCTDFDRMALPGGVLADGTQVVAAGGPDYYPGTRTSSPSFSFHVTALRVAGEGDLLAQIEQLRRRLAAEGLLEPQKRLPRAALPHTIGVVTGEGGKARDDVLAGLARRGWQGRLVWAFAPVQDRHAAPRIGRALQDLAATGEVQVIVVARGGGSLSDLMAFSDETLCRTVALLPVPVIASVGHHTDRPLIDDVAAHACSTPTHAAEAAVPVHCGEARAATRQAAVRLQTHGRRAVVERARTLERLARAPADHVARHRRQLHQWLREIRASATRGRARRAERTARAGLVLERKAAAGQGAEQAARRARLDALASALTAHDPGRVLERGYAMVEDDDGGVITSAADARHAGRVRLAFHDDHVDATVDPAATHDPTPHTEPTP
ncbi:Exodeoxyribonuclease 7 large subunit [Paraconexibacter sp. AEG42_29]|uniref:Exodeoxyribonuclease 7 large subunit n=1 Tax=Paraconexibacter sp. AEG42_29 TaxID=2997339 RepID=A0AAU7AZ78_9ACTN